MKIILMSKQQFDILWNKSLPMNRVFGVFTTPHLLFPELDAVGIPEFSVEIGSVVALKPEVVTMAWFQDTITNKKYFEVG